MSLNLKKKLKMIFLTRGRALPTSPLGPQARDQHLKAIFPRPHECEGDKMHPLPFHLAWSQNARSTHVSMCGDASCVERICRFVLQSPFVVWCYRSEAAITALLSRGSEGACAFCILGNANAIGKIYKCELGILFLLVKSPFQLRHLSQNQ